MRRIDYKNNTNVFSKMDTVEKHMREKQKDEQFECIFTK